MPLKMLLQAKVLPSKLNEFFIELLKKWKAEGKIRSDIDDEVILALFNSVPLIKHNLMGYPLFYKEKSFKDGIE